MNLQPQQCSAGMAHLLPLSSIWLDASLYLHHVVFTLWQLQGAQTFHMWAPGFPGISPRKKSQVETGLPFTALPRKSYSLASARFYYSQPAVSSQPRLKERGKETPPLEWQWRGFAKSGGLENTAPMIFQCSLVYEPTGRICFRIYTRK